MSNHQKTDAAAPETTNGTPPAGDVVVLVQFDKPCTLSGLGVELSRGARAKVPARLARELKAAGYAHQIGF